MRETQEKKGSTKAGAGDETTRPSSSEYNPFILEDVFPDPAELLRLPAIPTADIAKDAVYALDANALLVPFSVGKAGQEEIEKLYLGLHEHKRLFAPQQAVREFLRHRSRTIADLHQRLINDIASLEKSVTPPECAMLEYSPEYEALLKARDNLKTTRKSYLNALQKLIQVLADWRWDDPISRLYPKVFDDESVVECPTSHDNLRSDLARRVTHKLPPGYKDASKADGGIGDVIIWHSLLELGRSTKTPVVFVTGEEKADWMVRGSGKALFPRFELIAEFHRETGQHLAIVDYIRFLELHELSPDTVNQARHSSAEGLGRFDRLKKRILSILESLRNIASDYQYTNEPGCPTPIRDNRFIGLRRGFTECSVAYSSIYGSDEGLAYLKRFENLLDSMTALNGGIEYEEVRMKHNTEKAEAELREVCREFVECCDDFAAFAKDMLSW